MGEWLIADVSFLDVHLQVWMLLVLGILLCQTFSSSSRVLACFKSSVSKPSVNQP
jgi:hypothetical protein